MMRQKNAIFVVALFALALVSSSACTQESPLPISPTSMPINVVGTLTATPGSLSLGNSVNISWSAGSAVRVDACNTQCSTIATSGTSVNHTPQTRGEWKYVLYNVVNQPDVLVRADEQTVTVQ